MSLAIKYETPEDAKMRLRGTVVLYRGAPVLINDVRAGDDKADIMRVAIQELPVAAPVFGRPPDEEAAKRKYISSKHFDIAPFKMGYVNKQDKTGAFYCARLPNRVQKQGLCAENFKARTNYETPVDFATFLRCPEVKQMVAGEYPSFDRALASLDKVPSVAFHYDFCLVKDEVIPKLVYLYHKGKKVGMFNHDEITLGDKFVCLKESLVEMRLKVGVR